ncbi:hypothetical protein DDB_G0267802 [Dictyostelium discoideum AX4]|uniref:Putative uncharacterized protein DDB_G0267802 n=1 Tax=Dictyostelium discoideum TaxID=44689 RepID=Y9560_DICDI|nr:hypothetical protein DDB_G0267802 [Dictyostelium discoideum AX4]Q55G59.1 RecName: Full=Putative uncharacterized protein DDB_G0267802 [Dictyostelium discoideum]EAL73354.1 hypothetical protein DDB_G0267802 [Dictyostelium discoideum AX4]|eukprot:XP_647324.1 hypothetical protein DDB_G0267802 [Dictyostelium discoideum AX4]
MVLICGNQRKKFALCPKGSLIFFKGGFKYILIWDESKIGKISSELLQFISN